MKTKLILFLILLRTISHLGYGQWVQQGGDIDGEAAGDISGDSVSFSSDGNRLAIGAPSNDDNGINSGHVKVYEWDGASWVQLGQDIDGEAAGDLSGASISLSADGNRLAIGAQNNDGDAVITPDNRGHVRIYEFDGLSWGQLGQDIDGEAAGDESSGSYDAISLSADGSRVAIGADLNGGNGSNSGHVRVYDWNGAAWVQLGIDIDGEAAGDRSGNSVSLNSDGSRVAIGAVYNDGNGSSSGHVRVYEWDGASWVQLGTDINGEASGNYFGGSVSLNSDGSRVAIGASGNDGMNGEDSGHVRIYQWDGISWNQLGQDIDGEAAGDISGSSLSLSSDGNIVAIGAPNNYGDAPDSGHVRVYRWQETTWVQLGDDINGEVALDRSSAWSISLSSDGSRVAIGSVYNDGDSANVNDNRGHVRVFFNASALITSYGRQQGAGSTAGAGGTDTNTYFGDAAGFNTTGNDNTFMGYQSGTANIAGTANTFAGSQSGVSFNTANTVFIGYQSGYITTEAPNTFIGYQSGNANTTGTNNVFIGENSGLNNNAGNSNTFIGAHSGENDDGENNNTFIGYLSGENSGGSDNTATGYGSGRGNTSGGNTYLGYNAGIVLTGGSNTFLGHGSGTILNDGSSNVFLGHGTDANVLTDARLYIDNTDNAESSLIRGDFATDELWFNSSVRITGILQNDTFTQMLVEDTNGDLFWRSTAILADGITDADTDPDNEFLDSAILNGTDLELTDAVGMTTVDLSSLKDEMGSHTATQNISLNTNWVSGDGANEGVFVTATGSAGLGTDTPVPGAVLDVNGSVRIGDAINTLPVGCNLYVEEGLLTEKLRVDGLADWPDHVFEKDYRLKPLSKVAAFIKRHKYLPGMPSASAVAKDGIDLAQMDARLLEKIEALMLYTIRDDNTLKEHQKRIEAQTRQNTLQQAQLQWLLQQNEALEKRISTLEKNNDKQ